MAQETPLPSLEELLTRRKKLQAMLDETEGWDDLDPAAVQEFVHGPKEGE